MKTITLTVRPSSIFFKHGPAEDVIKGESAQDAIDRHNAECWDAIIQRYADGNGIDVDEVNRRNVELAWHEREDMVVRSVSYIIETCYGSSLNDVLRACGGRIVHSHLHGDADGCEDIGEVEMPDGSNAYIAVRVG